MKNFLIILFIVVCLGVYYYFDEDGLNLSSCEKICLVSGQKNTNEEALETLSDDYIITDKIDDLIDIYSYKAIIFYLNSSYEKVVDELDVLIDYCEDVDGKKVYYGYTDKYRKNYYVNNKKINVQIVDNGSNLIVGLPIILTGF